MGSMILAVLIVAAVFVIISIIVVLFVLADGKPDYTKPDDRWPEDL